MLPPEVTPESIEGCVCDRRTGLHWAPLGSTGEHVRGGPGRGVAGVVWSQGIELHTLCLEDMQTVIRDRGFGRVVRPGWSGSEATSIFPPDSQG